MTDTPFPDLAEMKNRLIVEQDVSRAVSDIVVNTADARILVSISRSLNMSSEVVSELRNSLGEKIVAVTSLLSEHSPYENIFELAAEITRHNATHILSIGGGSVIDGTKIALIVATKEITSPEELDANTYATKEGTVIENWPLRHIAVPTTLSGAEFTPLAGATSSITGRKEGFLNHHLVPDHIILSSTLSLQTPERLWLSSGVRSIDHAIETICAPAVDADIADACAEGLKLLHSGMSGSRRDGQNLDDRAESQMGVYYATAGLSRYRMGASHGLGYLLGVIGHVPHGLTSCVLLPAVMDYNLPATEGPQSRIARILGVETAQQAGPALREFIGFLGLPNRLSEIDVSAAALTEIKEAALTHPVVQSNARAITTTAEVSRILALAN
ncbi:iron-containing alcohol dehydrogenase [Sneathiella marina]|uniref:Iron-containing alcohol dehydrogenase n=1 Tax=Sneathiella marina TaxID=2950108 RepID=A0ABY4W3N9_9PROT|nr:iron-containing alcohol dehydrogenase [Sneathiella marina]USG61668.1 iron-containing alcohol dehydrogenase [Sneathiella marina]